MKPQGAADNVQAAEVVVALTAAAILRDQAF
jgi:hypothetical protein